MMNTSLGYTCGHIFSWWGERINTKEEFQGHWIGESLVLLKQNKTKNNCQIFFC